MNDNWALRGDARPLHGVCCAQAQGGRRGCARSDCSGGAGLQRAGAARGSRCCVVAYQLRHSTSGGAGGLIAGREFRQQLAAHFHTLHMPKASALPHNRAQAPTAASMRACMRERPSAVPNTGTASGPAQANRSQRRRMSRQHTLQGQPRDDPRGRQTGRAQVPAPQPGTWQFSCAAGGSAAAAGKHEGSTRSRLQRAARILHPQVFAGSAGCAARARSRQRPHSSRCPHAAEAKPAGPS